MITMESSEKEEWLSSMIGETKYIPDIGYVCVQQICLEPKQRAKRDIMQNACKFHEVQEINP